MRSHRKISAQFLLKITLKTKNSKLFGKKDFPIKEFIASFVLRRIIAWVCVWVWGSFNQFLLKLNRGGTSENTMMTKQINQKELKNV